MSIATVTDKKTNVKFVITASNKANEREVEMMVGKAMCAWANWQNNENTVGICIDKNLAQFYANRALAEQSEYEATVRCISLFVEQPTSYICKYIIARAKSEFGI